LILAQEAETAICGFQQSLQKAAAPPRKPAKTGRLQRNSRAAKHLTGLAENPRVGFKLPPPRAAL
jgi:hypothetical protein